MTNIERVAQAAADNGVEAEFLFTYKEWQKRGFQVQKGEKATLKVALYIPTKKKAKKAKKNEEGQEEQETSFIVKTTSLFTEDQVQKIEKTVAA